MFKVLDKQRTKDLETQEHTVALGLVGELEAKQWPDPAGECKSCVTVLTLTYGKWRNSEAINAGQT